MLTLAIAEARAQFSSMLERVQAGENVTITKGRKGEPIAVVIPFDMWDGKRPKRLKKRKAGTLAHWNVDVPFEKLKPEDLFKNPEDYYPPEMLSGTRDGK